MRFLFGFAMATFIGITLGYLAALAFLVSLFLWIFSLAWGAASKVSRGA